MEKTVIKCPNCVATFTLKNNMYAHRRTIHQFEHLRKEPYISKCHICDLKFSNEKCSFHYMKKFHNSSISKKQTRIKYPYESYD
ncbi:unnamed protein product [Macrosiphum euphorbiae]|uniref:C2H2-type domain-containing protein n=1 Tax=Macrosiphum euphorbiae TaxID=13131 RepID=A0AAV0XWG4_9HEMI|nr:unnamed protein product [Macrosiphum euphorbiae]